ncbi:cell wall-binding repeat-containing protein [Herbiconiux sp. CPCC 203407]|uniref:Cell wall-binding repeat-containing protein n=1 Tax=Herbiconiux oxytropis TaxID=2970915 RepID=A0AA41XK84_9MICO|nr:cell wall-binding repeat-containing protein [Herbiconiux oxytropis]MCS5722196.1 cell wall-binding repeat-containing protein [Herbiconiux oxytropis]MCS5727166.1 cell wall-binding repeat-containing protein [Herbiconiux oxytropis]
MVGIAFVATVVGVGAVPVSDPAAAAAAAAGEEERSNAVPAITEFDLGNPNGLPNGIVSTGDGTVWVSVLGDRAVVRLNRSGEVMATYPLTGSPSSISVDSTGGVWVAMIGSNRIASISAAGEVHEYPLPQPNSLPAHIWDGGDQVYFSEQGRGYVGRLTESTGQVEEWEISGAVQLGEVSGLADQVWVVDEGAGRTWIVDRGGAARGAWDLVPGIRDLDVTTADSSGVHGAFQTATGVADFTYRDGGSTARGVLDAERSDLRGFARAGARFWMADAGTNSIVGASRGGKVFEFAVPSVDAGLTGLAISESRYVWVLERRHGKVARLDTIGLPEVTRVGGVDRYDMAVNISHEFSSADVDTVFVTSGEKFADALSAGAIAGHVGGPLLLSRQNSISRVVLDEIIRLRPREVIVVGGPASVSESVLDAIEEALPTAERVDRVGGRDRYEVSRALLTGEFAPTSPRALYVASGRNFPDALSSTPAAVRAQTGVLLIDGAARSLSSKEMAVVGQYSKAGATIKVVGGAASVSDDIMQQLSTAGNAIRLGGPDRYAVSVAVNEDAFPNAHVAFLASGVAFADALAGGPAAGSSEAPVFLVRKDCVPAGVLSRIQQTGRSVWILGGENTLSQGVLNLSGCANAE